MAGSLLIKVKDKQTDEWLANVSISVQQPNGSITPFITNGNGTVNVMDVVFPMVITCSNIGYNDQRIELTRKDVMTENGTDTYIFSLDKVSGKLNEVVVTGQALPVLAKQSIYKVNTLSIADFVQRGAVNLNDVLNYEMNNFINNDNVLGSSVTIGGIGGQNIKILVNGIPISGRENGNIDLGQLNMNNIKRVEMVQGPMSVMYGSNALGGVINLITQTSPKKFTFGIRTYLESIGRYNFSGNLSASRKNHQVQFSVARNFFQGWTPKDSLDRYQLWKPKTQYTSDLQYQYTLGKLKLNYFGSYIHEKITNKGIPIISPYEGYAFDEYYRTNRLIQALNPTYQINETDQISLVNSYTLYKRTKNRFKKDLVTLNQIETQSIGDQDTSVFKTLNLRGVYSSKRIKHLDLMLGYEYNRETGISFKLAEEEQMMTDIAGFASGLIRISKLSIQPSFRINHNNRYRTAITPALHTKYDITSSIQLRASYARGFRAPSLKEMYLQFVDQNHTILGNPDLKPEIGDHIELGLDHHFKAGRSNFTIGAVAYRNVISNMITLAVYNNHAVLRKYANIIAYKNWMFNLRGQWSYQNINLQVGGGYITVEKSSQFPQHHILEASFLSSWHIKPLKTSLNFNYKYNSQQPVVTIDQQFLFTAPLHIANVSLQRSFFKKTLQAQVGVKNLFNIQNTALVGSNAGTGGHTSSSGMQVFPARSLFFDLNYQF